MTPDLKIPDRVAQWQLTHSGGLNVTGVDAGLDPWWTQAAGGLTTDAVKDITVLGYSYQ